VLGVLWLIDGTTKWSERIAAFWVYAVVGVALAVGCCRDRPAADRRTAAAAAIAPNSPVEALVSGRCSGR
jgi:hypothetical protein